MIHSILVPLDGSTMAEQALPIAAALAGRHAACLNLAVVHPWGSPAAAPLSGTAADRDYRAAEGTYLNRMTQAVTSAYRVSVCEAVLDGATGPALVEFARRRDVDLVVASTHDRGALGRFVFGGVVRHVIHQLGTCVLLLKPDTAPIALPFEGFTRILLATDGSPDAASALEPVAALAATRDAAATLFEVVMPPIRGGDDLQRRCAEARRHLADLAPRLTARGIAAATDIATAVNPAAAILVEATRTGADLIALTTRDRGAAERALFGSVADSVVHHAGVPVLVCHAGRVAPVSQ